MTTIITMPALAMERMDEGMTTFQPIQVRRMQRRGHCSGLICLLYTVCVGQNGRRCAKNHPSLFSWFYDARCNVFQFPLYQFLTHPLCIDITYHRNGNDRQLPPAHRLFNALRSVEWSKSWNPRDMGYRYVGMRIFVVSWCISNPGSHGYPHFSVCS